MLQTVTRIDLPEPLAKEVSSAIDDLMAGRVNTVSVQCWGMSIEVYSDIKRGLSCYIEDTSGG